jgi:hypothetical protein
MFRTKLLTRRLNTETINGKKCREIKLPNKTEDMGTINSF